MFNCTKQFTFRALDYFDNSPQTFDVSSEFSVLTWKVWFKTLFMSDLLQHYHVFI